MNIRLQKKLVLIIALMSYLLAALDNSLVLTSLAKIRVDLGINQISLSWIQNAYGLAYGSLILLSGKLGDLVGKKKVMIFSLSTFAFGSLISAISNIALLTILARFIQGIGAAFLTPTTLSLLIDYFTGKELNRAIAWYSSIAGIGMSVGLIFGGTLAAFWTWRIGFYANTAIAVGLIILSYVALNGFQSIKINRRIDILGALMSIVWSGLLVYGVNGAKDMLPFVISALVVLIIFILHEKKAADPIMPLNILKNKIRFNAYLSRGLLVAAAMGFSFFASEYMQNKLNYSPLMSGIGYLPLTITLFFTAIFVSKLIDSYSNEILLIIGSISLMLGFAWIVIIGPDQYALTLLPAEILIGLGQGFALAPQTNLGIYHISPEKSGIASSILNMFHQLGGVLGIALMVTIGSVIFGGKTTSQQFVGAMFVGLILASLAVVVSIIIRIEINNQK